MHAAVGDFQVSTYQADVLARTIGARIHQPAFLPNRSLERVPAFGLQAFTSPVRGLGARVLGQRAGARGRLDRQRAGAAREHGAARGQGPARRAARPPVARDQKSQFLLTGNVVDVCGGAPCTTDFTRAPRERGRAAGRRPARPR